jgi:hypothetical protein
MAQESGEAAGNSRSTEVSATRLAGFNEPPEPPTSTTTTTELYFLLSPLKNPCGISIAGTRWRSGPAPFIARVSRDDRQVEIETMFEAFTPWMQY